MKKSKIYSHPQLGALEVCMERGKNPLFRIVETGESLTHVTTWKCFDDLLREDGITLRDISDLVLFDMLKQHGKLTQV
ncbi:MAG: hypothetical protein LBV12_10885 [Puniceicoccales bacterium]|jgi:hypothetical protein|nr:hypothetical protein [Puniceicoccales bacterium]